MLLRERYAGMDSLWRIELLGRLRATQGDRVVDRFRARRTGALLAYLAYHLDRPHLRDVLIELLWPETELQTGRTNLRRELSSLRRQLEPPGVPPGAVLVASRDSVQLSPAACATDVQAFETALQSAMRARGGAERILHLTEVAERYRGELLPGYFEDWVLPERQRLAERFLHALAQLTTSLEQAGDYQGAIQWARRAVAADPLREEGHQALIRLLHAAGQPAAAYRQYHDLERLLAQELGASPAPETGALVRRSVPRPGRPHPLGSPAGPSSRSRLDDGLRSMEPPSGPRGRDGEGKAELVEPVTPSPGAVSPSTSTLLLSFTRFFGREREIRSLRELLQAVPVRLVTLIGPGGTGKTRLALETARQMEPELAGRVWFVSLLDLTDPRLIADKVLESLRVPRSPQKEPLEQITASLSAPSSADGAGAGPRPSLLVLDNFEHLVEGGCDLVRTLLERVESLTVLITSRRCLGLEGEQEFPVPPLPVPGRRTDPVQLIQSESVQLFVDRAQAVRPDFQVTKTNAGAIGALCGALEGLPLALELAAARIGVLTPAQMLNRLERRFEFLASGRRGADPRHRSLRAALEWSYQLLNPELQRFFAQLSVFRGGWTLAAAEAVCEEPRALDWLEELRQCSLVHVLEAGGGTAERSEAVMRFHLLETLREYGAEQLGPEEREAVAHRHASYYLAFAERVEAELVPADQAAWRERDLANLRAALAWLERSGRVQEALRLGGALRELITLVAGTGSSGYSGDNGPANQAQLNHPLGLALDAAGHLFIALGNFDARDHRVRKVDAITGIITTAAGAGRPGFFGDGGQATAAQLNRPFSVVVDGAGNLFIAEVNNHRVRKVTPDGIISTYAGSGPVDAIDTNDPGNDPQNGGFSGDNGAATDARLNFPTYLAADPRGNLFIADTFNHRVRKVTPDGIITTVAGTGKPGYSGDSGPAIQARLHYPLGLALDAAGNLFVVDSFNYRVRKVTPDGIITTVAGTGERGFSGDGAKATDAQLNFSGGVAVDSAGNLFVADGDNYRVRKVSPDGIITTVAGIGRKPYAGDSGRATETGLRGPGGLVIDSLGNLLISDSAFYHKRDGLPDNERVLKIIGVAAPGLVAGMPFPR